MSPVLGVRRGFRVLADDINGRATGGQMIVISDGKETATPKIKDILRMDSKEVSNIMHTSLHHYNGDTECCDQSNHHLQKMVRSWRITATFQ